MVTSRMVTVRGVAVATVAAVALLIGVTAAARARRTPFGRERTVTGTARQSLDPRIQLRAQNAFARLPLTFEANTGQTNATVRFLSRGRDYTLFLTSTDVVFGLRCDPKGDAGRRAVRLHMVGGARSPEMTGLDEASGKTNYVRGTAGVVSQLSATRFAKVHYRDVYPGVDADFHGRDGRLEYDFIVRPGANPATIRLAIEGSDATRIDIDGTLVLRVCGGELRQQAPVVYQDRNGTRERIAANYVLRDTGEVGFALGNYDASRPVVIDPVIVYSTYLGGSADDFIVGVAVDRLGNVFVAGHTRSSDFPTDNALFGTAPGNLDLFVAKIDSDGTALLFSTYVGGNGFDAALNIATDDAGSAYVLGVSESGSGFPTTPGAFRPTGPGAFVFKLRPDGGALEYSTFLDQRLIGNPRLAVDLDRNAWIAGATNAPDFPTVDPLQADLHGESDAAIVRLNAFGTAITYATFLGGAGTDDAHDIAVGADGQVYISGNTRSEDFPTSVGAAQSTFGGGPEFGDCWVAKLNETHTALTYATYLGGSSIEVGCYLAIDQWGNAYVTGFTESPNFPTTPGVYQRSLKGVGNAFVTKISASGTQFVYSTLAGGSQIDESLAIAVDRDGNAYVTGSTTSPDFPLVAPLKTTRSATFDMFLAKVAPSGSGLIYSTYFGGSAGQSGSGLALAADGDVYVVGGTGSVDFPVVRAIQPALAGNNDGFIAKVSDPCPEDITDRIDVFDFGVFPFLVDSLRLQVIVLRNKTATPVQGPIAYVMTGLTNAVFVGAGSTTVCGSTAPNPFTVVHAGSDDVFSPGEFVFVFPLFRKTAAGGLGYAPLILGGVPTH